jgi:hypothetical protein
MAPVEYIEMLLLPRQGIAYKKTSKLSVIEQYLLLLMWKVEAENYVPPKDR